MKRAKSLLCIMALCAGSIQAQAPKTVPADQSKMNTFVSQLMAKMTVD